MKRPFARSREHGERGEACPEPLARCPRNSGRKGSVLVVVVWMLLGASLIIYATQQEAIASQREAHARFQRACSSWVARGGIYFAVGFMNTFAPQPALTLEIKPAPPFYKLHKDDEPLGWFIAEYPYPTNDSQYGVRSEQARMPLGNLTTSAINILFADGSVKQAFRDQVAKRRVASQSFGGPQAEQAQIFRHPFELLSIPGVTLPVLLGQDWNDNGVLDPHEEARAATTPGQLLPDDRAGAVDRGIIDHVTAFSDGKFDPFGADPKTRAVYLGDWSATIQYFFSEQAGAGKRPPPQLAAPADAAWKTFSTNALTNVVSHFRIQCFGTYRGKPSSRVRAVVEYVQEQDASQNWYRVVDWRQD